MPGRDLVIAAVFAVVLHCSVALVHIPTLQTRLLSENRTLEISTISEYKRNSEVFEAAEHEAKEEEDKKAYDRKGVTLEKRVEKKADIPVEGGGELDALPKDEPVEISEAPTPFQAEPGTGTPAEKMVSEPVIPCYKSSPPPKYPEFARRRGYQGEVLLSVMISVDGTVAALKVKGSSGHPILDRAAMKAVAAWEFEPARRMGGFVPLSVDIPIRFVLRRP
ncbi:MAG: energy transducer TonB [Syntrophales bacterium]|nr:energy transducer TonB [Syntrophales bacterium]